MEFTLTNEFVQIVDNVDDWRTGIKLASKPLLEHGYISENYIDSMIQTAVDLNFYIVIMPSVAMPHARNEDNVFKNGFSVLVLKEEVNFSDDYKSEEDDVKVIIPLACIDNDSHMNMLMGIASVLGEEEKLNTIKNALTIEEILEVFKED